MNTIRNLSIYTTQTHGKWVAATACAPYFCFEADSEELAFEKAAAAIKFYLAEPDRNTASAEKIERFKTKNRVRASELTACKCAGKCS